MKCYLLTRSTNIIPHDVYYRYKKAKFKRGRKKKSIYAPTAKKLLPNQIGQITRCIAKENLRL